MAGFGVTTEVHDTELDIGDALKCGFPHLKYPRFSTVVTRPVRFIVKSTVFVGNRGRRYQTIWSDEKTAILSRVSRFFDLWITRSMRKMAQGVCLEQLHIQALAPIHIGISFLARAYWYQVESVFLFRSNA